MRKERRASQKQEIEALSEVDLLRQLAGVSSQIARLITNKKRTDGFDDTQQQALDVLHAKKYAFLVELLHRREAGNASWMNVMVSQYPNEAMHPFSRNDTLFTFSHPEFSNSFLWTRTYLNQLAKSEQTNVQEVFKLVNPDGIEQEPLGQYLTRTYFEIKRIDKAVQEGSSYPADLLNRLAVDLVMERFLPAWKDPVAKEEQGIRVGLLEHPFDLFLNQATISFQTDGKSYPLALLPFGEYAPETRELFYRQIERGGGYDYTAIQAA